MIDKSIILPSRKLMKWLFKITLKILLTPSTVKFPIMSHLVTTISVSGKIAFSHAPSLLNSSARPRNKNTRLIFSMSHTELLYNNLLNMILFELIYAFNKNLIISYSYCFEASSSTFKHLRERILLYPVKEVKWFVPPSLGDLKLHFVRTIPINSICEWEDQVLSCGKMMSL